MKTIVITENGMESSTHANSPGQGIFSCACGHSQCTGYKSSGWFSEEHAPSESDKEMYDVEDKRKQNRRKE